MKRFIMILTLLVGACAQSNGSEYRKIEPLPSNEFTAIILPAKVQEPAPTVAPTPKPTVKPTPRPTPKPVSKVITRQGTTRPVILRHRVSGAASWYCKAGVSVCARGYGPNTMSAAACGKLRSAMGANWRGKYVNVKSGTRSVTVRLIDWCGSKDKLIDLYWKPMSMLGGRGVLPVTVSWK